jgi:hypothetical protein
MRNAEREMRMGLSGFDMVHVQPETWSTSWGSLQNRVVTWDEGIMSRPFLGHQWDV